MLRDSFAFLLLPRSFLLFCHPFFSNLDFPVYKNSVHPGQRCVLKIHPFQYDQARPSSFELKRQDHLSDARFRLPLSVAGPVNRIPSTHGEPKSCAVIKSHLDFAGQCLTFDTLQRSAHRSIQYGRPYYLLTCSASRSVPKVQSPFQDRVTLPRHTVMNGQQNRILQSPPWLAARSTAYGMLIRLQRHGDSFLPLEM